MELTKVGKKVKKFLVKTNAPKNTTFCQLFEVCFRRPNHVKLSVMPICCRLVVDKRKWGEIPVKVGSLISMHQNFHKTLHIMRILKLKKFLVKTLVQKNRICCQLFWSTFRRWNYVKLPWDCLCEKQPNLCNAHLLQTTSCRWKEKQC